MTLTELLSQGEGETVEFKQSLSKQNEIVETVAAFATGRGGCVLVGIRPDGSPVGVEIGRRTLEDLSNRIALHTDPAVTEGSEERERFWWGLQAQATAEGLRAAEWQCGDAPVGRSFLPSPDGAASP